MSRILVIAPHADDEVFGMGGTILKAVENGHEVLVLVCVSGTIRFEHSGKFVDRRRREKEFADVCAAMGASGEMAPFMEDAALDTVPQHQIIAHIEGVQDRFLADTWYIAGPSYHQDHRAVFTAALAAARPSRARGPKSVLLYELPLYAWTWDAWRFTPHLYEDVSRFIDRKIEICKLYESQVRTSGPISPARLREWAMACGSEAGVMAAERFQVIRIFQ